LVDSKNLELTNRTTQTCLPLFERKISFFQQTSLCDAVYNNSKISIIYLPHSISISLEIITGWKKMLS